MELSTLTEYANPPCVDRNNAGVCSVYLRFINRYCTDICLAGLRKTTNILSVESRSPGRDYQNTKQENAGGRYFDTERRDWLRV